MIRLLTLFIYLLICSSISSQVGINTTNPKQTLDVEGRIEIGDDTNAQNTEGSIKYDQNTNDFQGFTGNGWQSFTQGGGIPSNAQFVYCRRVLTNNSPQNMTFYTYDGNIVNTPSIPTGKYILVTHVLIIPRGLTDIDAENPLYSITLGFGSPTMYAKGKYTGGNIYERTAGFAPIAIIRQGVTPYATNSLLAVGLEQFDIGIEVMVTGFLVDNLDFD